MESKEIKGCEPHREKEREREGLGIERGRSQGTGE